MDGTIQWRRISALVMLNLWILRPATKLNVPNVIVENILNNLIMTHVLPDLEEVQRFHF